MNTKPRARRRKSRYVPLIVVGIVVIGVGGAAVALVRNFLSSPASPPKQIVQQIQLIRPPPPPPDLPPPPPPPPEEKVDMQEPQKQPDPTPSNEPPPSEHLGLDAAGGAGSDAFGLVGNKGGRDLLAGGAGSAFAWYAGLLKDQIVNQLGADKKVRSGDYSLTVRVWVREDGSIQRVSVVQGSGDRARDQTIEAALEHLDRLPQAPPADMPEPISLRIVSRG